VIVVPQVNKSMMTMVGEDLGTLDALNHCYYGHETGNVPAAAMFMALDFAWRRGRFDNAHSIGVLSIETTSWNYAVAALRLN
jgi:3-oxoacyl-[acyl-carrier-protein] synthase III